MNTYVKQNVIALPYSTSHIKLEPLFEDTLAQMGDNFIPVHKRKPTPLRQVVNYQGLSQEQKTYFVEMARLQWFHEDAYGKDGIKRFLDLWEALPQYNLQRLIEHDVQDFDYVIVRESFVRNNKYYKHVSRNQIGFCTEDTPVRNPESLDHWTVDRGLEPEEALYRLIENGEISYFYDAVNKRISGGYSHGIKYGQLVTVIGDPLRSTYRVKFIAGNRVRMEDPTSKTVVEGAVTDLHEAYYTLKDI